VTTLVVVESPFAGDIAANTKYAEDACMDCILRNETPFASHLFFTQFLDDNDEGERECGIRAGFEIGRAFKKAEENFRMSCSQFRFLVVFYVDRGWSPGMEEAFRRYTEIGAACEIRRLSDIQPSSTDDQ
jgi:hypothetical protein